jgi:hypothetical protein
MPGHDAGDGPIQGVHVIDVNQRLKIARHCVDAARHNPIKERTVIAGSLPSRLHGGNKQTVGIADLRIHVERVTGSVSSRHSARNIAKFKEQAIIRRSDQCIGNVVVRGGESVGEGRVVNRNIGIDYEWPEGAGDRCSSGTDT